jgi:methylenetetrahydrofolate reductase (NADPH)
MIAQTPPASSDDAANPARSISSRFQRALDDGGIVITAELAVPATVAHEVVVERALELRRPNVVAINVTDGLRGRPALSPIAAAAILTHADLGPEPIVQLTARSRSRNMLIADLLGACALGVRNLLCMTGDVPDGSADIHDIDVFGLIELARAFPAGVGIELIGQAAPFTVGAAWSPFAPDPGYELARLERKVAAGAQFVQTQPVFDGRGFVEVLERLPASLKDLPIIMGLATVRSAEHARRLTGIPGIVIPERLLELLDAADGAADAVERYWEYLDAELEWVWQNSPVRGCHLMPFGHSKRGIKQRSSFDRLYDCAVRITGAPPRSGNTVGSGWLEHPISAMSTSGVGSTTVHS